MHLKHISCLRALVLLLVVHVVSAQPIRTASSEPMLRHAHGLHGIELNAGITAVGKSLVVDWSYYFSPCWQIKAGIGVEVDKLKDNAYRNIFTQPILVYTILSNHRNLFFNILGGTKLHFESFRPKHNKERNHNFNAGLVLGGETEIFIANNFEILLSGGTRMFLLKTPYGNLDYFLNLGLRFSF